MAAVSSETKKRQLRDLSFWLIMLAWGTGAFIYGWLLAGTLHKREYWNFTFEALGWADWGLALICGLVAGGVSFCISFFTKPSDSESQQLFRIVVAVLPALFLVSALAVLTLTLATYNVYWKDARRGIATAFAALIAAVGVVVSVAVSYKTGEENRLAQQENLKTQLESQQKNLETQLEHQRLLEEEKGFREQQKLDAELIKNLNDRLHEIIARRYSAKNGDSQEDVSGLVSASYFQLAALYKDWETLAATSPLIALQKESQQRNILKLLFGVYQESGDGESSKRSEVDIRTLNSVIQDIFPVYQGNTDESVNVQEPALTSFDLSYLDLRGLDISTRDLRDANLVGAHLEGANLWHTYMGGAELDSANLVGANLVLANLTDVTLRKALLKDAWLWEACLRGADLSGANLAGSELLGSDLNEALMEDTRFTHDKETLDSPAVRERIIGQLKLLGSMLKPEQLRGVKGFDKDLQIKIRREWIKYKREMKVKELMDNPESE